MIYNVFFAHCMGSVVIDGQFFWIAGLAEVHCSRSRNLFSFPIYPQGL